MDSGFIHRFEAILSGILAAFSRSNKNLNTPDYSFRVQPPIDAGRPRRSALANCPNQSSNLHSAFTIILCFHYVNELGAPSLKSELSCPNAQLLFRGHLRSRQQCDCVINMDTL